MPAGPTSRTCPSPPDRARGRTGAAAGAAAGAVAGGVTLVHVAQLLVVLWTGTPARTGVIAATAVPWVATGLWTLGALVLRAGVRPGPAAVALTAGALGVAAVADVLRSQCRGDDLVVRLGGEELAWVGA